MAVFENEKQTLQGSEYYAHLNRNWDNGNKQFDAMNARINAKAENSAPGEVIQARIDANGNVYKSLAGRLDANQKVAENASYIANSAYTYAKTELYKKLSQMNNGVKAFADINKLKQAYPNGSDGIFVTVDTGHQWYYVDGLWRDAGIYQASSYDSELRDARVELDGTNANTIGNAIRDQFFKEKKERIADLNAESIERSKADAQIEDRLNLAETALELKEVRLKDNANNLLWDGNNYVTGNVYLPRTDKTGVEEGVPIDSSVVGQTFLMHLEDYGLPIMYLNHLELEKLQNKASGSIDNEVRYSFQGISGVLEKIKIQGHTSQGFPKKNYSIKFSQSIELKEGWGSHKSYVIKADWVDFSQMRNEIGAKIWGQIRKTRIVVDRDTLVDGNNSQLVNASGDTFAGETTQAFANLNFGSIDAYPIFVVINGVYWGLYSMATPKDDWIANMGNGNHEAMISAENHGLVTGFKQKTTPDASGNLNGEDFAIEYVSDEDAQAWVTQKLNAAIDACLAHYDDDATYVSEISKHIDLDSAIDYYIFSALTANLDGTTKNFLLDCWHQADPWHFAAYDMDATFGNNWDGKHIFASSHQPNFEGFANNSRLMEVIYKHDKQALINRYQELRKGPLSESNLHDTISDYAIKIPKAAYDYEAKRWPSRPGTVLNNAQQILSWINERLNYLDQKITTLTN